MKPLKSLFVIDDDAMYRYIAESAIKSAGLPLQISVFPNGREAIDALERNIDSEENLPDLILLDLMMPIMDGWAFLNYYEQLKPRLGKQIVIYIVTTSNNTVDLDRAKQISDVTGYVIKPMTHQKFVDLVEKSFGSN